jgi:hypothetical protein
MKLFVKTVIVDNHSSIVSQLSKYLRGQWVMVRGMMARIVNVVNGRAVLWMLKDKMVAVFA